jgi:hypothetical protein
MCLPTDARFLPTAFVSAPKHGLPLKNRTLLELVRSSEFAQNMELYAHVMSITASGEQTNRREQVEWIKTYLLTQRFFGSMLKGVDDMVNKASCLPYRAAASCAASMILGSELKYAIPALGQDMYRLSAMSGFPAHQVKLISRILGEVGVTIDSQAALRRQAEQEQLLLQEKIASCTYTYK